jgi:predicted tellurium resistance membrane protein TerC
MTLTLILGAIALVWLLKMIGGAMDEKGALLLAGWVLIAVVALAAFLMGGEEIGPVAVIAGVAWGVVVAFVNLGPKAKPRTQAEIDAEARRSADLRWKLDP